MYSRYARIGRRPFKLRLDSPDAAVLPLPFCPGPGGSESVLEMR